MAIGTANRFGRLLSGLLVLAVLLLPFAGRDAHGSHRHHRASHGELVQVADHLSAPSTHAERSCSPAKPCEGHGDGDPRSCCTLGLCIAWSDLAKPAEIALRPKAAAMILYLGTSAPAPAGLGATPSDPPPRSRA